MTTFADLLASRLRRDPGRPLVTFYDDDTGERVELSVATYANWVAKTSSLLAEEYDAEKGATIRIDLPTHWLGPVFLGAAWNLGLVVDGADRPDLVVCGPDQLDRWRDHPAGLACSLRPLGARFAEPLPGRLRDFGVEVWSQPDAFVPWDPPTDTDEAVPGRTQADLFTPGGAPAGERLLTTRNPVTPEGLATFVRPLVHDGSTIWVRHPDEGTWPRRSVDERATAEER